MKILKMTFIAITAPITLLLLAVGSILMYPATKMLQLYAWMTTTEDDHEK